MQALGPQLQPPPGGRPQRRARARLCLLKNAIPRPETPGLRYLECVFDACPWPSKGHASFISDSLFGSSASHLRDIKRAHDYISFLFASFIMPIHLRYLVWVL